MRVNKLFFITLSLVLLSTFANAQNLENRAKELGISQSAINNYKNSNKIQQSSTSNYNSDDRARIYKDSTTLINIDTLKTAEKEINPKNTRFGTELFNDKNLSFEPNFNIATPSSYKLAAGDEVIIDVWGAAEQNYKLLVSPEGTITIPKIGVLSISSLTIEQAERKILSALSSIYSGMDNEAIEMNLSLGNMRSVKVNVVGEAKTPGTYTLPSLSTLFNVLYLAGGVSDIGSLRNIKLYRDGKLQTTLDIYDFLINGDNSSNIRLEDNDIVIIEPYGNLIATDGALKRERIYELKDDETIADLVKFGGGFRGDAYTDQISVRRKNGDNYEIKSVVKSNFDQFTLRDGDLIEVKKSIPVFNNRVTIAGAVWRDGDYEIREGISTLKELISQAGGLKGDAFTDRVQISRLKPNLTYEMFSIDIQKLLNGQIPDVKLESNDKIYIPSIYDIIEKKSVKVFGEVNNPKIEDIKEVNIADERFDFSTNDSLYVDRTLNTTSAIYFKDGMTVEDAILLAGGMKESAAESVVTVSRRIKNPDTSNSKEFIAHEYNFAINGDLTVSEEAKNFKLEPFDEIIVRKSPVYIEQRNITITGEVEYPGRYVLTAKDQRLSDIIGKSGGFTSAAYIKGARLVRLKSEDEIERDMVKINSDYAVDSVKVDELVKYYSVGIDLTKAMEFPKSSYDPVLREGDLIVIPELNNTVKISGGVLYANTVTFIDGKKFKYYIDNAGGYVQRARKKAYVVYMNGTVALARNAKIEPGCEIIVPMKSDKVNSMGVQGWVGLATSVTTVAAMTATMINSLR